MRIALAVLLAASAAACVHPRPRVPDEPYRIADEEDFGLLVDRMWAMSPGRDRDATRGQLAGVYVDRATAHVARGKLDLAHDDLLAAADLYAGDPDAIGPVLAPRADALRALEARFARAGADRETATTLVLLMAADPARKADYAAQLDEVLAFADDLAAAAHGDTARGGGAAVGTLAPITRALPARWLVDRYVAAVIARQVKVAYILDHDQATFDLVEAHRDVGGSAIAIATVLARAGRPREIAAAIAAIHGFGEDATVSAAAAPVAGRGGPTAWIALADALGAGAATDPRAALGVCSAAIAGFGATPDLLACAARHAASMGRVEQPIALYEAARAAGETAPIDRALAALQRERLARLYEGGRPNAAHDELARDEKFLDAAAARFGGDWDGLRAELRTTAGRGLLGLGDVDGAHALLAGAVRLRPGADALAALATIAIARQRWDDARGWAARGLALPADAPDAELAHAKLLRLYADASAGAGKGRDARGAYLEALREWADLNDDKIELAPDAAGLRLVESAKVLWSLGEKDHAIDLLDAAMDVDEDGTNTYLAVVEMLLGTGELDHAADAVHRALGADGVSDYNKTYLSLYLVAEEVGAHRPPDPLADAFLRGRGGALWPDDLARLATGRADLASVTARATTPQRAAELAYYRAMLGIGAGGRPLDDAAKKALLDRVVQSDLITFFEYDMARLHEHLTIARAVTAPLPPPPAR